MAKGQKLRKDVAKKNEVTLPMSFEEAMKKALSTPLKIKKTGKSPKKNVNNN